jgi:hypothetical protein
MLPLHRSQSLFRFAVGQDLVGLLGPHEWLAAVVPGVDEPADGIDQGADGREAAAVDRLPRDDREEHLDEIQPARRCERSRNSLGPASGNSAPGPVDVVADVLSVVEVGVCCARLTAERRWCGRVCGEGCLEDPVAERWPRAVDSRRTVPSEERANAGSSHPWTWLVSSRHRQVDPPAAWPTIAARATLLRGTGNRTAPVARGPARTPRSRRCRQSRRAESAAAAFWARRPRSRTLRPTAPGPRRHVGHGRSIEGAEFRPGRLVGR